MSVNIFVSLDQYCLTEKFVILDCCFLFIISKDKQARTAILYFFYQLLICFSYIIEIYV